MKFFRRFFLLFSCVLLLSIAFSSIVSAETLPSGSYIVDVYLTDEVDLSTSFTFTPNNNLQESESNKVTPSKVGGGYKLSGFWKFYNIDGSFVIPKGEQATVALSNAYFSAYYSSRSSSTVPAQYYRNPSFEVLVYYADNTFEYVETTSTINNANCYVTFEVVPRENIIAIQYNFSQLFETTSSYSYLTYYVGEIESDNSFILSVDQKSEEVGLLDKIKGGLSDILEWIKGIKNAIDTLDTKISIAITDKVYELFVPTEQNLTDFKNMMEELLHDRFGAVAQVVDITLESWDRINGSDYTDSIEFPRTEINLPNEQKFAFGGYTVKIVPDGFEPIALSCKLICAMSVTLLFVNGLRKRYENVVGS